MTGEITLTGRVLPIGGLKEKTMAAYKNHVQTVIIPYGNLPDLRDIDDTVKENISFAAVKTVDEVFKTVFGNISASAAVPHIEKKQKLSGAATAVLN